MTPLAGNLLSWGAQVLVVGAIGALLPLAFRLRHPRSHLTYCRLVLAVCLALPIIQPWRHPSIIRSGGIEAATAAADVQSAVGTDGATQGTPWGDIILWTFAAGVALRLAWFCVGLWQIRRYRNAAIPLSRVPDSIRAARRLTKADALFCVSPSAHSPVTFGFYQPIILLPESFLKLDENAQLAIACHELLHVERRDWAATVVEEAVGALFWFSPAAWWLLAQTRLAREQLVDAEVVRITANREPYIQALLTIAGAHPSMDLTPAPLFLRRRHLVQRMHSILTEVSMSKFRLLSSYVSMTAVLAGAGWLAWASFPLVGQAQVQLAAIAADPPGITVNPGGVVLRRGTFGYPAEARQKRIEGTVFAELMLTANGDVSDARIISGPDELRRAVLQSVLQWRYSLENNASRTVVVSVEFRIPPGAETGLIGGVLGGIVAPRTPGQRGGVAGVLGTTPPTTGPSNAITTIDVSNVAEPFRSQLWQRLQAFEGQPFNPTIDEQIQRAVREQLPQGSSYRAVWRLADGKMHINILEPAPPPPPPPPPPGAPSAGFPETGNARIRVEPEAQNQNLIEKTVPVYPPLARAARVTGVVILDVLVGTDGHVSVARVVSGHPLLQGAALDAVNQWVYKPTSVGGQPVEVQTTVTLNFQFQ